MKALVIGSTGFVGMHLMRRLDQPIAVGRSSEKIRQRLGDVEARIWDPGRSVEPSLLAGVDTVFHLAGESVFNGRWNAAKKEKIRTSRVDSTRRLVDGIASCAHPPKTLICSSAIGFYGDRGAEKLTEGAAPGHDFLAGVCEAWEDEALRAQRFGVRVVCVRTGVVLGKYFSLLIDKADRSSAGGTKRFTSSTNILLPYLLYPLKIRYLTPVRLAGSR